MSTIQKQNFNFKTILIPALAVSFALSSCGGKQEESLSDLKAKQAELKTQLSEISNKISKLEGDSGKKFVLVEAMPVKPEIFKTYINVQGRVDADENVSLSSEMPGTITKINVKAGDEVSKGQVLAETDARALQQSISDLQTNADLVNQMYTKQKALWDQKIGTEVQFLQAKTQKESMEKKLMTLQEQVRMTKIISPINGTVDAVDIKLGQLTAPGMPAIRVINFSNLKLKADLSESYASKVHKGDEVIVKFPDSSDTLISRISYSSRAINTLNRTFGVEIALDNKKEFHPNQIAILNINDYSSPKPVIAIPLNFVQKDLKGSRYVLVADNKKAAKRQVMLGKEYGGKVEILNGLSETDLLITSGYDGLNEGDAVEIKK
ncbi:MAG: efflux transporter, family, subunit [Bacteroidota bacterium]|jgi:RND family efflux transporter MFP subunit|nr:efflux transporter, family, subunit [Bacteroidota bacterium]